jgi:hypothetical protein
VKPAVERTKPAAKKRGNLAASLDPLLQPRVAAGRPGRPKGTPNYEWTPEIDRLLTELCAKSGAAKAKRLVGRKLLENRPSELKPRWDSVRKAVEHRISRLGLAGGEPRKKAEASIARRWTAAETATLLGALGADARIETIALRTGHSVKAVRAKLARLDYRADDINGVAVFTFDEIAERLGATPRQIRRWKERGWLATNNRRVAEDGLERFVREHADLIPFDTLAREDQIYLLDLGYPVPERKQFRQNVREVLDGIGRQRKRRCPTRRSPDDLAEDGSEQPPDGTNRKLSHAGQ